MKGAECIFLVGFFKGELVVGDWVKFEVDFWIFESNDNTLFGEFGRISCFKSSRYFSEFSCFVSNVFVDEYDKSVKSEFERLGMNLFIFFVNLNF